MLPAFLRKYRLANRKKKKTAVSPLAQVLPPRFVQTCPRLHFISLSPSSFFAFTDAPHSQHFIDTGAGVIDADYRGQVKILLFNHSETDFQVSQGDRVAQLVLERIYTPEVVEVEELADSVRGAGGFGSTGGFGGVVEPVATTTVTIEGASDAPAPSEKNGNGSTAA